MMGIIHDHGHEEAPVRILNICGELSSVYCVGLSDCDCYADIHLIDEFEGLRCLDKYLGLRIKIFRLVTFIEFFVFK